MKDRAVLIGAPNPLVGIVTEPEKFDKNKPMVLLFNSGVMHRVGSCRMSVKIAKRLADLGFASIRFDFSGIGDSEARRGTETFEISSPKEAIEVMDYLQKKRQVNQFVLYGLCSGADASYHTALLDERVVGISQIDAFCYRTLKTLMTYVQLKIVDREAWSGLIERTLKRLPFVKKSESDLTLESVEAAAYVREFPPKAEVEKGLKKLIARDVHMQTIFTGADKRLYNYTEQFNDCFKTRLNFKGLLDLNYYADASHIVTEPEYQKIIVSSISQWVEKIWGAQSDNA